MLHVITGSDCASLAEASVPRPPAGNPLGVPELHNFCAAGAETALGNSIEFPNHAEQLGTDEVQDAGGWPHRAIHYAGGEQMWIMN